MRSRFCNEDDVEWMLEVAKEFNDTYFYVPLNESRAMAFLMNIVREGVALRTDDAVIIGSIMDDPMRDWCVLVELGWFSRSPGQGLTVLKDFVDIGRRIACHEVRMTTLATNVGAERILHRLGFSPTETSHRLLT